mmetsp:Transcript_11420/g.25367  ORF Transcript_11420/g.25367 Transcript_11420/m.25367 type:complete len:640 (+) Transcript_11420:168-2087(+)
MLFEEDDYADSEVDEEYAERLKELQDRDEQFAEFQRQRDEERQRAREAEQRQAEARAQAEAQSEETQAEQLKYELEARQQLVESWRKHFFHIPDADNGHAEAEDVDADEQRALQALEEEDRRRLEARKGPQDRRLDPEDGQACSWAELCAKYQDAYSREELEEFWDNNMTIVPHGSEVAAKEDEPEIMFVDKVEVAAEQVHLRDDVQPEVSGEQGETMEEFARRTLDKLKQKKGKEERHQANLERKSKAKLIEEGELPPRRIPIEPSAAELLREAERAQAPRARSPRSQQAPRERGQQVSWGKEGIARPRPQLTGVGALTPLAHGEHHMVIANLDSSSGDSANISHVQDGTPYTVLRKVLLVRKAPSTRAPIVGRLCGGTTVSGRNNWGWLCLDADCIQLLQHREADFAGPAFVLMDGKSQGFGQLLRFGASPVAASAASSQGPPRATGGGAEEEAPAQEPVQRVVVPPRWATVAPEAEAAEEAPLFDETPEERERRLRARGIFRMYTSRKGGRGEWISSARERLQAAMESSDPQALREALLTVQGFGLSREEATRLAVVRLSELEAFIDPTEDARQREEAEAKAEAVASAKEEALAQLAVALAGGEVAALVAAKEAAKGAGATKREIARVYALHSSAS